MLNEENLPRTLTLRGGWCSPVLTYIDQTILPYELVERETFDYREVIDAITALSIRGAPALGVAGAAALCLWCAEKLTKQVGSSIGDNNYDREGSQRLNDSSVESLRLGEHSGLDSLFFDECSSAAQQISGARPTAVNLSWGVKSLFSRIEALFSCAQAEGSRVGAEQLLKTCYDCVKEIEAADEAANRALGAAGAALLPHQARVLTHCNAGSLATAFYGTALGVVYAAAERGGIERVYADETRPVNQGSRLTVWELSRMGIPTTLICDNMAASLMAQGKIDAVVVGADRITRSGDVANKIGTYSVALAAQYHGVPFYVAAPISTIDFSLTEGSEIPIEERSSAEVMPRPLKGVEVYNPAFDVTPAHLVTAIITECGVFTPSELHHILER